LLLNLANIETRHDDGKSAMTLMRADLPKVELALGALRWPVVHSMFQQLHNYPVGMSGKDRVDDCRGNKYNIQPIRREFLSGIDAIVCARGDGAVEEKVRLGVRGTQAGPRYGLPFLGDNSFLIDRITEGSDGVEAYWLLPMIGSAGLASRATRLTVAIDRADMTRTKSALLALPETKSAEPPEGAWLAVP
jgi:CRISPR-associated protein Cas5t